LGGGAGADLADTAALPAMWRRTLAEFE